MKDSNGNDLPKMIWLKQNAGTNDVIKALAVNSFVMAAELALMRGHTVTYDKNSKKAKIERADGSFSEISHH